VHRRKFGSTFQCGCELGCWVSQPKLLATTILSTTLSVRECRVVSCVVRETLHGGRLRDRRTFVVNDISNAIPNV
jgi:hypothetical protein